MLTMTPLLSYKAPPLTDPFPKGGSSLTDAAVFASTKRLLHALKRRHPDLEWLVVREWRRQQAHAHALLRTSAHLTNRLVKQVQRQVAPHLRLQLRDLHDVAGAVHYVLKAGRFRHKAELAPPAYRGRLISTSQGFLEGRSLKSLWAAIQADRQTTSIAAPVTPEATARDG
jgi:hypothetical protein